MLIFLKFSIICETTPIAVIGGFVVALPLLLVVLPAFIQLMYRFAGER